MQRLCCINAIAWNYAVHGMGLTYAAKPFVIRRPSYLPQITSAASDKREKSDEAVKKYAEKKYAENDWNDGVSVHNAVRHCWDRKGCTQYL